MLAQKIEVALKGLFCKCRWSLTGYNLVLTVSVLGCWVVLHLKPLAPKLERNV